MTPMRDFEIVEKSLRDMLDHNFINADCYGSLLPYLKKIKQALTELEETKILCESFKNDANRLNQQGIDLYLKYKKQTQILKILKEKVVDIWEILNSVDYCDWRICYKPTNKKYLLTKEEFDLLKEWLNEN